jgi:N-acetylmuramoyl-L-alanine amidase
MNKPTHIIIHHSLTRDSDAVSWGAIRWYHVERNGWRDIGYHFGIELVNGRYEVQIGRDESQSGAHCVGMNNKSIGICCVGNFDIAPPAARMLKKLRQLVGYLMRFHNIPIENVRGHQEYSHKSCPGKFFDMEAFRESLNLEPKK